MCFRFFLAEHNLFRTPWGLSRKSSKDNLHDGRVSDISTNVSRREGHPFDSLKDVFSSDDSSCSIARRLSTSCPRTSSGVSSRYRTRVQRDHKNDYARDDSSPEGLAYEKPCRPVECDAAISADHDTHAPRLASAVVGQNESTTRLRSIAQSFLHAVESDSATAAIVDTSEDRVCLANFGGGGGGGIGNSDRVHGGRKRKGNTSDVLKEKGGLHKQQGANEELEFSSSLEDSNENDPRFGTLVMLPLEHGFSSGDCGLSSDDNGLDYGVAGRAEGGRMAGIESDGGLVDSCKDDSSDDDLDEEQSVADVTNSLDFLCDVSFN